MSGGPYLSANGRRATSCNVLLPYYGAPVADITLADATPLPSGPFAVTVGDLTLRMAVGTDAAGNATQRAFAGSLRARLVGGSGTWQTPVTVGPYALPSGVMASTVLRDVVMATSPTAAARERVSLGADKSLGAFFVPGKSTPAARILAMVAGALWWIDAQGVTQIAATRPTFTIKSAANVVEYPGDTRILSVATEDWASWLPGGQYSSATVPTRVTVYGVRIHSGADGVARLEAMVS